ncbi:MAG: heavy-metal-associated domain-containing protein [Phycisphaerales bacterium]|nr:MAG: heavy-metal-associated domain-containing protein [Phycisphaerales bacterium]
MTTHFARRGFTTAATGVLIGVLSIGLSGCDRPGDVGTAAASEAEAAAFTQHFKIDGMFCSGCEQTVRSRISELDGVVSCEVSHREGTAVVRVRSEDVIDRILSEVDQAGFEISLSDQPALEEAAEEKITAKSD